MLKLKTITLALFVPAALSGCASIFAPLQDLLPDLAPETEARLFSGAVVLPAPDGFCLDPEISRARAGFALFAPCANIVEGGDAPSANAIITVQAGQADTAVVRGSEDTLAAFLETPDGAAMLGDAVSVTSTASADNEVRVAFDETGGATMSGTTARVRRAFFDIDDRVVTVSVRSLTSAPLTNRAGRFLLKDVVAAAKRANDQADSAE